MKKNFQIGFFGDGKWSHKILFKLLNDESLKVKFICPRFIDPDQVLKKIAFSNKLSFLNIKDINSESSIKKLREFNCDLFVSMSYNQILSKKIFTLPKLNTINCHAGKLPFYRGRNPLNWVLINGEKEWGITVHFIDEGIDTGDIIDQKIFKMKSKDNYFTLLKKAHNECPKILYNSIKNIQKNQFKTISQTNIGKGSYFSKRKKGDEVINWNTSALDISNFIRALSYPGPIARSFINQKEFFIYKAEIKNNIQENTYPGKIIDVINKQIIIQAKQGILVLSDWNSKYLPNKGDVMSDIKRSS